jgi:hypothetical protein
MINLTLDMAKFEGKKERKIGTHTGVMIKKKFSLSIFP